MKSPDYNVRLSVKKHNDNIFYYLIHTHTHIYKGRDFKTELQFNPNLIFKSVRKFKGKNK